MKVSNHCITDNTNLQSAGNVQKSNDELQNGKAATGTGMKPVTGTEDVQKICYKCKKAGHLSRDCPENPDEGVQSHSNGGIEYNSHTTLGNPATEMDRVAMVEDDIHEIGEEDKGKLNDLDYFTGNPLPNDIILYAVPVCGPCSAIQSYKYCVKIIPGTAKKGKGSLSCKDRHEFVWSHARGNKQRERIDEGMYRRRASRQTKKECR